MAAVSLGTIVLIIEAVDSASSYERDEARYEAQQDCEREETHFQDLLDQNDREVEAAQVRERAGLNRVADALERLTLANLEEKPPTVIKLLAARVKREEGYLEIDTQSHTRLIEQGTRLLQDKSRIFDCSSYLE